MRITNEDSDTTEKDSKIAMMDKDLDIDTVIVAFKKGVEVKDRRYRLQVYKNCFVASEAVDFLVNSGLSPSRDIAVELCKYLQVNKELFRHVTGDHEFKDKHIFFEFCKPNAPEKKPIPPSLLNLYGVKEEAHGAENSMNFASQQKRRSLMGKSRDDKDARRAMVLADAEKTVRETKMAEKINERLLQSSLDVNSPFTTEIKPEDMRCLALVAHNHMKPTMKAFIEGHSEILKKFRLTGTNTTISMCKTVYGEDNNDVVYGPTCTSGPLGGDAQLAALLCLEDVGAIMFFMDPLSPHPHQADIDSLVRLSNVHNVILCTNPTTAIGTMWMLRQELIKNRTEMFPSFFETLESPSVPEYKAAQEKTLESAING